MWFDRELEESVELLARVIALGESAGQLVEFAPLLEPAHDLARESAQQGELLGEAMPAVVTSPA